MVASCFTRMTLQYGAVSDTLESVFFSYQNVCFG